MSGWTDSLEELAESTHAVSVHLCFRQGARDGVSAAESVAA
jgi:hypothetical protein